jgi:hypothetical protein
VSLQCWLGELAWRSASDFLPELLGSLNICAQMPAADFVYAVTTFDRFRSPESGRGVYKANGRD